jgi:hypothetical protein
LTWNENVVGNNRSSCAGEIVEKKDRFTRLSINRFRYNFHGESISTSSPGQKSHVPLIGLKGQNLAMGIAWKKKKRIKTDICAYIPKSSWMKTVYEQGKWMLIPLPKYHEAQVSEEIPRRQHSLSLSICTEGWQEISIAGGIRLFFASDEAGAAWISAEMGRWTTYSDDMPLGLRRKGPEREMQQQPNSICTSLPVSRSLRHVA